MTNGDRIRRILAGLQRHDGSTALALVELVRHADAQGSWAGANGSPPCAPLTPGTPPGTP
jgi:hypothetical protein